MNAVFIVSGAVAITVTLRGIWRARKSVAHTTLVSAWRWSLIAIIALTMVWMLAVTRLVSDVLLDLLWYGSGLLLLCPPIAVLGARRPGIAVWTSFVILPLLAVLGWPLLTVWTVGSEPQPLRLDTPVLLGFSLVLIMGVGNYFGTRFGLSAAAYSIAVCLIVGPVSEACPTWLQGSQTARMIAIIALSLSYALAVTARTNMSLSGFDRVWSDYRETFGIVWARRFQDRINGIAQQQHWPVRLEQAGFRWRDGVAPAEVEVTSRKIDQTLRWLLRRFVDAEWIDARIGRVTDLSAEPPLVS